MVDEKAWWILEAALFLVRVGGCSALKGTLGRWSRFCARSDFPWLRSDFSTPTRGGRLFAHSEERERNFALAPCVTAMGRTVTVG